MRRSTIENVLLWSSVLLISLLVWALIAVVAKTLVRADTTFGMSNGDSTLSAQDKKFGRVDVVRVFNTGAPKAWSKMPNRPVVVSFKIPPKSVIHGEWDGFLRNWFRTAPKNHRAWWAYWHEPVDNFPTKAGQKAYRQAWRHIVKLERQYGPRNLRSTYIATRASTLNGAWQTHYAGDKWIDVLAFDGKLHTWDKRYIPAYKHYAAAMKIARSHKKPFALAEYGSIVFNQNYKGRAQWMRDTAKWLNKNKAAFGCWWPQKESRSGAVQDHRLNDAPSVNAMRWMLKGAWQ